MDKDICLFCAGHREIYVDRSFIEGKWESGWEVCPRCHGTGFQAYGLLTRYETKMVYDKVIDACVKAVEEMKVRELTVEQEHG